MVSSAIWQDLLNLNLCESIENVGLYIIFKGLLWWLFISLPIYMINLKLKLDKESLFPDTQEALSED
jgi:hypothetical protein